MERLFFTSKAYFDDITNRIQTLTSKRERNFLMKFLASLPQPDDKVWKMNHDNNLLYIYNLKPKFLHVKLKYRQKNPNDKPEIYFENSKCKIILSFDQNEIVYHYQKLGQPKRLSPNEKVVQLIKYYKDGAMTRLNMSTISLMMNDKNVLNVATHNYVLTKSQDPSIFFGSHGIRFKDENVSTSQLYRGPLDERLLSLSLLKKHDSYKTRELDFETKKTRVIKKDCTK